MFAFVLLCVLVATVFVLPKSNHELFDSDEWSFWVVHVGSTIVGKIRLEEADDTADVDTDSDTHSDSDSDSDSHSDSDAESNAEQCDTNALSSIQRRWKIYFRRKSSAAARVQRWWRRCIDATVEEASSEESYQLVDHVGDESTGEDVSIATLASDDVSLASHDSDDMSIVSEEDEGYVSDASDDVSVVSTDDDCDWYSVRHRGFGAFSADVLSGLEGRDRTWAKVGLRQLRQNFRWTWVDSAWMFFTHKGRTPPSALDTCPDNVRARLFAPHVWLSNDPYFAPSEIEWTRSVQRWTRR